MMKQFIYGKLNEKPFILYLDNRKGNNILSIGIDNAQLIQEPIKYEDMEWELVSCPTRDELPKNVHDKFRPYLKQLKTMDKIKRIEEQFGIDLYGKD